MKDFALIFFMMLVTFGVRYPVLALVGKIQLPAYIERALKFVPVVVLSALSAPIVLIGSDGDWNLSFYNPYLVASLVAMAVAWKTRHLLLTIVCGMFVFVLIRVFMA